MEPDNGHGLTLRELVLRLERTVTSYIEAHARTHDLLIDAASIRKLAETVASHERTLQRITGALILLSVLGVGTLVLVLLRLTGLLGT